MECRPRGLPNERGRADLFGHYLRGLKLDLQLTPDRLAAELANAAQGLTGAYVACPCQRAAMFCVGTASMEESRRASDHLLCSAAWPHYRRHG